MKWLIRQSKNNSGATLVEVIIAMLILSLIASAALWAFVFSIKATRDNQYVMAATNLANDRIEYIRALSFANIGTKHVVGATTIYGDPKGEILQAETKTVDGVTYLINTTINWEDESGWELSDVDWDYKSIRVEVVPQIPGRESELTKVIDTYVTRDSSQPLLTGANIALRMVRGWKENPSDIVPVAGIKISLTSGPSAPRQVQTSTNGIARFLSLNPGAYSVKLAPSTAGMILLPGVSDSWGATIINGETAVKELAVEYPCYLDIRLKSLEGNAITLGASQTGIIKIDVPYGTAIDQSFGVSDFASPGCLSQNLFGELWPVGAGYSGAYTVTDISMENSTYFGAYETSGGTEIPWAGTFNAPGTVKILTCYFGVIPPTPSGIGANWTESSGEIVTGAGPYTSNNAIFATADPEDTIVMQTGAVSDFDADELYIENTGSAVNPGLLLRDFADLRLNAGIIVFRGRVQIETAAPGANQGKITLSTVFTNGANAHNVPGSAIEGLADPGKMYGKVYFVKPLVVEGSEMISPGGYYFYDGQILPDNASELIPITKDNYVN